MNRKLFIVLLAGLLGGCVNLGGERSNVATTVYVLADTTAAPVTGNPLPHTLLVEDMHASAYDDSEALVFSHAPNTRGRYKYARWSERPSTRLSELLFNRLSNAHVYATVVTAGSDVIADRRLATELLAFYHDAAVKPGQVQVTLRAELYDSRHHRLIARHQFEKIVAVTSYDATGAAAAFNLASQGVLSELGTWLGTAEQP